MMRGITAPIASNNAAPAREREFVLRARQYLDTHYSRPVMISELADLAGVSADHLRHVFSDEVGCSPSEYLTRVRVLHATALLKAGRPIKEVANDVGFFDQAHLTRHFRRAMRVTPAEFVRGYQRQ